jgi:2-hydroxychromene-2-carboxylate isomerase
MRAITVSEYGGSPVNAATRTPAAPDLRRYAAEAGLDLDRLAGALEQGLHRGRIEDGLASGVASGVAGTPTLFIEGRVHDGSYAPDVDAALRAAARRPA